MTKYGIRLTAFACLFAFGAAWADTETVDGTVWSYSRETSGAVIERQGGLQGVVVIPSSLGGRPVVRIADSAFYGNRQMTSVLIPESVTAIGRAAFFECTGLTSVNLPRRLQTLGYLSFSGCSKLTSVSIPSGLAEIGEGAFSVCSSLETVTIPSGVRVIGASAFSHCPALTSVRIPASVTEVGPYAFYGCTSLSRVEIESQATVFGLGAFSDCPWSGASAASPAVDLMDQLVSVTIAFGSFGEEGGSDPSATEEPEAADDPNVLRVVQGDKVEWATGLIGYKAKGLPSGLKYNKTTGLITGAAKKATDVDGAVVTFTLKNKPNETRTVIVEPEEMSVSCAALSEATLRLGVSGGAEGYPIDIETQSGVKSVKVAKLPSGLKYNKKTGLIEGAPIKAGTFNVTVTVTAKSGSTAVVAFPVTVEPLPAWATGSFGGLIGRFVNSGDPDSWRPYGTITLKVAANGKLTATVAAAGKNYKFSAKNFESIDEYGDPHFRMTTRSGDVYEGVLAASRLDLACEPGSLPPMATDGVFAPAAGASYETALWRNENGKDGRLASDPTGEAKKALDSVKALQNLDLSVFDESFGSARLKIAANGQVKLSGVLADGTKMKGSSFLMLDGGDRHAFSDFIVYDKPSQSIYWLPTDWVEGETVPDLLSYPFE